MFESLRDRGFEVEFTSHAEAIIASDFATASGELESAIADATIPIEEIIAGGGGETDGTQRLRRSLTAQGWTKIVFVVQRVINGVAKESQSHEVDHCKTFDGSGTIVLEIEWNNKDPFFDRDLENFKRLHADGAISAGVIVTRGRSMQADMRALVRRFVEERGIDEVAQLEEWGYSPTARQRKLILDPTKRKRNPLSLRDAFARAFVSDKFGAATTHWDKLADRIRRGVGNPCPLVLVGIPSSVVTFHEGKSALAEVAPESTDDLEA